MKSKVITISIPWEIWERIESEAASAIPGGIPPARFAAGLLLEGFNVFFVGKDQPSKKRSSSK